jgi:outer membrane protein OmpA-like peptidoglycan-associated protein
MNVRTSNRRAAAIALAVAACATGLPAQAAEQSSKQPSSKQESIGVASGLTVGALAGGPFGAVIGAATGAWLGGKYHKQKQENQALTADLAHDRAERARLSGILAQSQSHEEQLAKMLERRTELETQVIFRTKEATLPPGAFEQLEKMSELASTMPDMRIRVSGYADPRGTNEENDALSRERADAVAAVLAGQGIDASRLVVEAHGESEATAAKGDMDGYALERRVTIRLEQPAKDSVAQAR